MQRNGLFYIDGAWRSPHSTARKTVVNPATEEAVAVIALGDAVDTDIAVQAARRAFETYSRSSLDDRKALLERVIAAYEARLPDFAAAVTSEMGAPAWLAAAAHSTTGLRHFHEARRLLDTFEFEQDWGETRVLREPIGVCALISPWNWPLNQIGCKVAPALATGCTMVLKPSELAPLNAMILAEVMDEAGVPPGVFNLVNGDGPGVGSALAAHPDVDMISFTGSTRAGIAVSLAAADTVKRVSLELGGKSPNIILEDADLRRAVRSGVFQLISNTGQSCNAPSRMLVPRARYDEAVQVAAEAATKVRFGVEGPAGAIGPLANANQFEKVQGMIQMALDEGARVVAGGPGRPEGYERGFFVRPTVFADVTNTMRIAREEVFGPVLVIIAYDDEEEAVRIANDTEYGLSCHIHSEDLDHARRIAARIRSGTVHLNGAAGDSRAPFGGYKRSGNGREWGVFGFEEYLETKAVLGWIATNAA